jgi:Glyoxalase superfamily protein
LTKEIRFQQVIPILGFDVPKTDEFYLGLLGFTVDWGHRFDENAPFYRQISREGHLAPGAQAAREPILGATTEELRHDRSIRPRSNSGQDGHFVSRPLAAFPH